MSCRFRNLSVYRQVTKSQTRGLICFPAARPAQTIGQFTRFSGVAFEPRGDCEGSVSEIYFLRPKSRKLSLAFSLQCWRSIRNGVIGRIVGTPEISLRCSGTTACASGRFESLDVTLAYLRSKDAESEEAQEHANSSSLALMHRNYRREGQASQKLTSALSRRRPRVRVPSLPPSSAV